MKRFDWTMALAGAALVGLIAGGAQAQTAEPAAPAAAAEPAAAPAASAPAKPAAKKAKKKTAASGGAIAVSVWNSRAADLTELQVAPAGSDAFKKALGKLKAGKKTGARVPKTKDCLIDLHATFADGQVTEASGVDVCTQKVLNLTD
ncbi:hypothetical protein DFR50_14136 [Roseiarcus fermentans]|uniref:Uncharacterized protein n=1 Tax=Roseiarcus fermentans TaxID=1473586 RepID=A0A366EP48_9HYPH|nr:hypothetical protein [Roseiarcus fermentans]RBP04064.1 hypothetical protein DFR50_14136 [Roseiarcus fermentans]